MDSFWSTFWTLLIFIPLLLLWVFALIDLFGNPEISGLAKALWAIAIVLVPIVGMITYFVVMYPSDGPAGSAPSPDLADQLTKLAGLRDDGVLTEDEFQREKDKLLGVAAAS
ncbi:MAG: SHOCT domain-containing protein [Acidobacteria bacterium]|nr:SHOCT domain-containing protein [Acidobacteriota bacterium]